MSIQAMASVPLALAMVVCDAIWSDPGTGKKTILGTFSAVFAAEFPLELQQLSVYIALTDSIGKIPVILKLVDVDELRDAVQEIPIEVEFPDPITICEGAFQLKNLIFPEPGEYRLQLLCDGEIIIERRILVISPTGGLR